MFTINELLSIPASTNPCMYRDKDVFVILFNRATNRYDKSILLDIDSWAKIKNSTATCWMYHEFQSGYPTAVAVNEECTAIVTLNKMLYNTDRNNVVAHLGSNKDFRHSNCRVVPRNIFVLFNRYKNNDIIGTVSKKSENYDYLEYSVAGERKAIRIKDGDSIKEIRKNILENEVKPLLRKYKLIK